MSGTPWPDSTPENLAVVPRGGIRWLPVRVEVQGVLTPPDVDAFTFSGVRAIYDPDGNDVTADFVTNELDPAATNPTDIWDENHADYVGDQAAPEQVGLFARHIAGQLNGQVAQKVKAPLDAEVTLGSTTRRYKVVWGIRLFGQVLQDKDGELHEFFHVAPAGVLSFGGLVFNSVDWAAITAGITSSITDPIQQQAILQEAADAVQADIEGCGYDVTTWETLPLQARTLIILYARNLLFAYDGSAGLIVAEVQELSERVKFTGRSDKAGDRFMDEYLRRLASFCRQAPGRMPMIGVINKDVGHSVVE